MVQQTLAPSKDYLNHPIDTGCNTATEYLGKQSLCIDCPFESCIKEIRYSTKLLLQSSKIIRQVHEAHYQGLTIEKISKLFNDAPFTTIQYWIKHKKRIQKLLDQYSWAISYLC